MHQYLNPYLERWTRDACRQGTLTWCCCWLRAVALGHTVYSTCLHGGSCGWSPARWGGLAVSSVHAVCVLHEDAAGVLQLCWTHQPCLLLEHPNRPLTAPQHCTHALHMLQCQLLQSSCARGYHLWAHSHKPCCHKQLLQAPSMHPCYCVPVGLPSPRRAAVATEAGGAAGRKRAGCGIDQDLQQQQQQRRRNMTAADRG